MINFSAGAIDLNFLDQKPFESDKVPQYPKMSPWIPGNLNIPQVYKGFATLRLFWLRFWSKYQISLSAFKVLRKMEFPSLSQKLVLLIVFNSFEWFFIANGTTFLLKTFVL